MLNKHAIFGHMIPNYVLFTRPTMRGLNYETMANNDDIYMVLSLEEIGNYFSVYFLELAQQSTWILYCNYLHTYIYNISFI